MGEGDKERKVREALENVEAYYGQVPFITKYISDHQDLYLGYAEYSRNLMFEPKALDQRTMELCAIAAGSSLSADFCLDVHLRQAAKLGASDDEMFEAIMVGAYMAMTKCQASALRRLKDYQDKR
ncbi:MAG: Carboxymuconolactone decarboxylase family protein [Methanomassiliicoccales archaeon PtaU1.Bin124]|nr:MAG: Carboxymuconolactone decarboxylase family protein [Methanomassiliicoccales archaeon PtaU1.Bin124]